MDQAPAPRKGPNPLPNFRPNMIKLFLKGIKEVERGEKHNSGCGPSLVPLVSRSQWANPDQTASDDKPWLLLS